MLNSPNSNPKFWVSSQDGSVRFDAGVILNFFENDAVHLRKGDLARELDQVYDSLAETLIEKPDILCIQEELRLPVLRAIRVIRDLAKTVTQDV